MSLLKRFELWVLLILIGGGLYYVFNMQDSVDEQGRPPIAESESDKSKQPKPLPRFSLQKTTVTRDGDRYLAEIEIHCRNDHQQTPEIKPPVTRLLAANGNDVPPFFLPFAPPLKVHEPGESDIILRFWLSHDDINGPVSLHIGDDTIPIKAGGFEADLLPDKQSCSFTGTDWSSKA